MIRFNFMESMIHEKLPIGLTLAKNYLFFLADFLEEVAFVFLTGLREVDFFLADFF